MKLDLYLPYYDYNDGEFDADDSYYGDGEYANAMYDDFMKNKDIVESHMNDAINGHRDVFTGMDGKTYKFGAKAHQSEDKVSYSKCEAVLYNEDGLDETVDGLIKKFAEQTPFIEMIMFDLDTSEEDFESEYFLWENEHNSINAYLNKAGEEWVAANEPKRNIKIHFKNKANDDIYALFENCKIMDNSEKGTLIVYAESLTLIDKI